MNSLAAKPPLRVAVVIPCYKVKAQVADVIARIPAEVADIIVVDDSCPEKSGDHVVKTSRDDRVAVILLDENRGVGGATVAGMKLALKKGADIIVKLDGDGQYDPALIPVLISPIVESYADVAKGNRFYQVENLTQMPFIRIVGNAALSFVTKMVSGYWNIMDPTNGFIAIHGNILRQIPVEKLDKRYYFESDLLFRLNTARAVVHDVPLAAMYGDEVSSLSVPRVLFSFPGKQLKRIVKRIFYSYFLRDFNIGSICLILGILLTVFGSVYTISRWVESLQTDVPATAGMVMIGALQLIVGMQLLLAFLNYDVANVPRIVQYKMLGDIQIKNLSSPVEDPENSCAP